MASFTIGREQIHISSNQDDLKIIIIKALLLISQIIYFMFNSIELMRIAQKKRNKASSW